MDLEKIKELMSVMEDKGITKLALKEKDGFELELEKTNRFESAPYATPVTSQLEPRIQEELSKGSAVSKEVELKEGHEVTSPMVGTFYTAPSPEAGSFVKVGDAVTEETVIGIIEAMKVMNEIKAGKSGIVTEIYVDNAHPVEYGTKLLRLG